MLAGSSRRSSLVYLSFLSDSRHVEEMGHRDVVERFS